MSFRGFFLMCLHGYRLKDRDQHGGSDVIIDCPVCGPRHLTEFTYGGEAERSPVDIANPERDAWEAHVFARRNPRGLHDEHWQHSSGCRSWLQVRRDVTSHRIESVRLIGAFAETRAGQQPS